MRRATLLAAACLLACGGADDASFTAAPPRPRAVLRMDPPVLGVGQVAAIDLVVTTPHGYAARAYRPPSGVEGLWILDSETLPVREERARQVHTTRIRVRAREVGRFALPESEIVLEDPQGNALAVPVPEHPIEVASILPEYPDRLAPFGFREVPEPVSDVGFWGPAAAGAAAALSLVGLVALARRRRSVDDEAASGESTALPPWETARAALAEVRARTASDPIAAANTLSGTLRRFFEQRFGVEAVARTHPELAGREVPFAARSRWPTFLALVETLDALRFRSDARERLAARLPELIEEAARLVEAAVPPQARR